MKAIFFWHIPNFIRTRFAALPLFYTSTCCELKDRRKKPRIKNKEQRRNKISKRKKEKKEKKERENKCAYP